MIIFPSHSPDESRRRFWLLVKQDLGLLDAMLGIQYVDIITDSRGRPLSKTYIGMAFKNYKNRGYWIQIKNGLCIADELETTLHECRHIYQYKTKLLVGTRWKGEKISRHTPYNYEPWELDARRYTLKKLVPFAEGAGYIVQWE